MSKWVSWRSASPPLLPPFPTSPVHPPRPTFRSAEVLGIHRGIQSAVPAMGGEGVRLGGFSGRKEQRQRTRSRDTARRREVTDHTPSLNQGNPWGAPSTFQALSKRGSCLLSQSLEPSPSKACPCCHLIFSPGGPTSSILGHILRSPAFLPVLRLSVVTSRPRVPRLRGFP